jgi:hypothetical protein
MDGLKIIDARRVPQHPPRLHGLSVTNDGLAHPAKDPINSRGDVTQPQRFPALP